NVTLNLKDKNKLQSVVLGLKKIKGVEEVNYKT
ncbi:MAG: hypothetical protein UV48_C0016G0016, partial [Candidatus Azambacteria bacterium GW2011_GWA2_42_9]